MALLTRLVVGGSWRAAQWRCVVLCCMLTFPGATGAQAPAPPPPAITAENQLKAVFLFNFAQFVEWPARTFKEAKEPIVIGMLGDDPFGAYLDELVRDEKIGERPIIVRRYPRVEDVAACHILFISRSEAGQLDKILAQIKARSLLSVGDMDGFNRLGGMVRFATDGGKIQLRINVAAARAAELTISSKLLAHATIVPPGKD